MDDLCVCMMKIAPLTALALISLGAWSTSAHQREDGLRPNSQLRRGDATSNRRSLVSRENNFAESDEEDVLPVETEKGPDEEHDDGMLNSMSMSYTVVTDLLEARMAETPEQAAKSEKQAKASKQSKSLGKQSKSQKMSIPTFSPVANSVPTNKPTPSPSRSPSEDCPVVDGDNSSTPGEPLERVTNPDGFLGQCQGDCEGNDELCDSGLTCYSVSSDRGPTTVPGCSGELIDNVGSYCTEVPDNYLIIIDDLADGGELKRCQGSCDVDGDCAEGLSCFQRGGGSVNPRLAPVPGCCGLGRGGSDYCYDPNDMPSPVTFNPTSAPTDKPSFPPTNSPMTSDQPTSRPSRSPSEDCPLDNDNSSTSGPPLEVVENPVNGKFGPCQGDCNNDNSRCELGLTCYRVFNNDQGPLTVPGCSGEVTGSEDFCTEVPNNYLNFVSNDPTADGPFKRCQGDCNNDSDCGDLQCFQRGGGSTNPRFASVPGCCGLGRSGSDYCYDPNDGDPVEQQDASFWTNTEQQDASFWGNKDGDSVKQQEVPLWANFAELI